MVQSRSIRLAVKSIRVMVPAIDLLNHGGESSHGFLALSGSPDQGQSICFVAKRTVAEGAQVLWSYGNRCNVGMPDSSHLDLNLLLTLTPWLLTRMTFMFTMDSLSL